MKIKSPYIQSYFAHVICAFKPLWGKPISLCIHGFLLFFPKFESVVSRCEFGMTCVFVYSPIARASFLSRIFNTNSIKTLAFYFFFPSRKEIGFYTKFVTKFALLITIFLVHFHEDRLFFQVSRVPNQKITVGIILRTFYYFLFNKMIFNKTCR